MKKVTLLFTLFLLLNSCLPNARRGNLVGFKELIFRGKTMGTSYTIRFLIDEKLEKVKRYKEEIDKKLLDINKIMSSYEKESEVTLLNKRNSPTNFISYELAYLIDKSLHLSELTKGAYDITAGELINAWGFGPLGENKIPSSIEIQNLKQKVGYQNLKIITNRKHNLLIKKKSLSLDLSSIAKGYGVDQIGLYLIKNGFTNHMIEIGGEIKTMGFNIKGKLWKIGIRTPSSKFVSLQRVITLHNESLATSGDYENHFTVGGIRYSHIIDPRVGSPITHDLVSVSVIHRECALADAWSTALLVMGKEKGMAIATRENLSVLFITRDDKGQFIENWTPSFDSKIN